MGTNFGMIIQTQKKYETQKTELDNQIQYNNTQIDKNSAEITDLQTVDETDRIEVPERSADDIKSEVESDFQFKYDAASQTLEQELASAEQNYSNKCIQINTDYSSKENSIKTKYQNQINELNSSFNFDDEPASNNDIDGKIRQLEQKQDEELKALKSEQDAKLKQAEEDKQNEIQQANQKFELSKQNIAQEIATETDRRIADERAKAEANAAEVNGDTQKVNDRIQTLTVQNKDLTDQNTALTEQSAELGSQIEELKRQQEALVPEEETTSSVSTESNVVTDETDAGNTPKLKKDEELTKEEKKARKQALNEYEDRLEEELGKEYKIKKDKDTGTITAVAKDGSGRTININMGITENGKLDVVRTDNTNADQKVVTHTTHNIDGDKKTSDIAQHETKDVTTTYKKDVTIQDNGQPITYKAGTIVTENFGNDEVCERQTIEENKGTPQSKMTIRDFQEDGNTLARERVAEGCNSDYTHCKTLTDSLFDKNGVKRQENKTEELEGTNLKQSVTVFDANGQEVESKEVITDENYRTGNPEGKAQQTIYKIINGQKCLMNDKQVIIGSDNQEHVENETVCAYRPNGTIGNKSIRENDGRNITNQTFADNGETVVSEDIFEDASYNEVGQITGSGKYTSKRLTADGGTIQTKYENAQFNSEGQILSQDNITQETLDSEGHKLKQVKQDNNGKTYQVEYDGNGNTKIVVQNGESIEAIAKKFGTTPEKIKELNHDKLKNGKYFSVGDDIVVPGEIEADEKSLQGRGTAEQEKEKYAYDQQIKKENEALSCYGLTDRKGNGTQVTVQQNGQNISLTKLGNATNGRSICIDSSGQVVVIDGNGKILDNNTVIKQNTFAKGKKVQLATGQTVVVTQDRNDGHGRKLAIDDKGNTIVVSWDNQALKDSYVESQDMKDITDAMNKQKGVKFGQQGFVRAGSYKKDSDGEIVTSNANFASYSNNHITGIRTSNGDIYYYNERTGQSVSRKWVEDNDVKAIVRDVDEAASGWGTDEELLAKATSGIKSPSVRAGVNAGLKAKGYEGDSQTEPIEFVQIDELSRSEARVAITTLARNGAYGNQEQTDLALGRNAAREIEWEAHGGWFGYTATADLKEAMRMADTRGARLACETSIQETTGFTNTRAYINDDGFTEREFDKIETDTWVANKAYDPNNAEDREVRHNLFNKLMFVYQNDGSDDKEAMNIGLRAIDSSSANTDDMIFVENQANAYNQANGVSLQFKNQSSLQAYLDNRCLQENGTYDVDQLSSYNRQLYSNNGIYHVPSDIQAQEILLRVRQNDHTQDFTSSDKDVYSAMQVMLSNGEVRGFTSVQGLYDYDKAEFTSNNRSKSNDATRFTANAIVSGQVTFTDEEKTEFCIQLMHNIDSNHVYNSSEADYQREQLQNILQENPQLITELRNQVQNGNFSYTKYYASGNGYSTSVTTDTKDTYLSMLDETNGIVGESIFLDDNNEPITDPDEIQKIKNENNQLSHQYQVLFDKFKLDYQIGLDGEGGFSEFCNSILEGSGLGTSRGDVESTYRGVENFFKQAQAAANGQLRDNKGNVISYNEFCKKYNISDMVGKLSQTNNDYKTSIEMTKGIVIAAPVIIGSTALSGGSAAPAWVGILGSATATAGVEYAIGYYEMSSSLTGVTTEGMENLRMQCACDAGTALFTGSVGSKVPKMFNNSSNMVRALGRGSILVGTDILTGAASEYIQTGTVTAQGTAMNMITSIGGQLLDYKSLLRKNVTNQNIDIPTHSSTNPDNTIDISGTVKQKSDVDIAQIHQQVTAQNDEWIQTLEAHRSASKGLSETEIAGIRSHIDNIDDIATLTQLQNQLLGDGSHSKIAMTTADRQKFRAQFDEAAERITHQGFLRDLNSSTADITAARQLIESSTTLSPTHKSDLLRQADAILGQRDYDAAIAMINGGYSRYEDNTAITDLINGSKYLTDTQKNELLSLNASSASADAVYNSLLDQISEVSQQGSPLMRDLDSGWNGTRTAYGQALDGFDVQSGHQRYGYIFSAEGNSDLRNTYGLLGATPDAKTKFMDFGVSLSSTNLDKLQKIGQLGRNLGSDFQIELQGLGAHMIENGALRQDGIHAPNARDYGLTPWDAVTSRGIDAQTIDDLANLSGCSYNMRVDADGNPVRTTSNGWNEIDDVRNSNTGFHAKVYEKEGKVTIAFSGSDDVKDIVSDHQIVNGQIPDQMQDVQKLVQKVKTEYPDAQILVTGHSLGGFEAEMAASLPGCENITAVTFDAVGTKGLVTSDAGVKLGLTDNGNSVNFVVRDDLISNANEHTGITIITDKTNLKDEHAIQQFLGEGNSLVGTQGGMTALNDARLDALGTGTVKIKNPDGTVTKKTGNFTLSEQIRLQGNNVVLSDDEFRYTRDRFQADVNSLNADLDALEDQISHLASIEQRNKLRSIIEARRNALKTDFNIASHIDQSKTVEMTGNQTNALLMRDYGFDKPAFPEGNTKDVRKITLKSDATFVRVYCETGNPPSFAKGVWLMSADEIKGLTPAQIKDKFALPGMPSHVVEIKVDAGSEMISGACGKIEGWGNGGGTQYFLTGGKSHTYSNFRRLVNN